MEEGEEKEDFFKLPVEEVLLRWFNHHLRQGATYFRGEHSFYRVDYYKLLANPFTGVKCLAIQ